MDRNDRTTAVTVGGLSLVGVFAACAASWRDCESPARPAASRSSVSTAAAAPGNPPSHTGSQPPATESRSCPPDRSGK